MNNNTDQTKKDSGGTQQGAYPLDRYTVAPKSDNANEEQSPFYKSAAPSISIPKGGGALKSIDEKFSVNAVNGTASMQIALPLTPGRNGFTPNLSLQYNSGGGNSEFGLGWGLSLPAIQRRTDKKTPIYDDANESDVFTLSGAEDLQPKLVEVGGNWVPVVQTVVSGSNTYTIKEYMPRIEGIFARIEFISKKGDQQTWWKVTTKDNIVTFYGLTAEGCIWRQTKDGALLIYKWMPQISYDNKGNTQQYLYRYEHVDDVPPALHEKNRAIEYSFGNNDYVNNYLYRVAYCNIIPQSIGDNIYEPTMPEWPEDDDELYGPVTPQYQMLAIFDYSTDPLNVVPFSGLNNWTVRGDAFSTYHAGFEIRTYRRCARVIMIHEFQEIARQNPAIVRSLDFTYHGDTIDDQYQEADYITSITENGYLLTRPDGISFEYSKKSLPTITFDYQALVWDNTVQNIAPEDIANSPQGLTGPYQWIDMLGEGLPGILTEQAQGWFYKRNLGNGYFAPMQSVAEKPSFTGLGTNMQWQDLHADGRRQLVSTNGMMPGYFELDDDQQWLPFRAFKEWAEIDWNSPYTKVLDLNGDGRPDVLITEDRAWRWYGNEGTEGYINGGYGPVFTDDEQGPMLLLNDMMQVIFLADMNGDGITDIVRITNGEICYWPNMGYGRFDKKVTMSNAPVFDTPDQFNTKYITLADISGTGAADIIYLGKNKCTAWINLAGNAWGTGTDICNLPDVSTYSKVMVADILGNGTPCIVWSSQLPQYASAPMRYIDLMGGNKPYLLASYANGMGKTVQLAYLQSTKFYLEDMAAGEPWATRLPFPVHCVTGIITADSVSSTSYVQSYSYHHGYYDHAEREFRGFGRVDTIDTDLAEVYTDGDIDKALDQLPVLTKTWYHTGAWMRESTLTEAYALEYVPGIWADLPTEPLLPAGLTAIEQREAVRALKGQPLRQEVYAITGPEDTDKVLYTITTNAYAVNLLQNRHGNRYASFYSFKQQGIAWSFEGATADPRVVHDLTISVDAYGNVLEAAKVAYPRLTSGATDPVINTVQHAMLATYTVNTYTTDAITSADYHLRLLCNTVTYELTGMALPTGASLWTPATIHNQYTSSAEIDFTGTPTTGSVQRRAIACERIAYLNNDGATVLSYGTIDTLGLPYQHYKLAFTGGMLTSSNYYKPSSTALVTGAMFTEGGYLSTSDITATVTGFPADSWGYIWVPSGTVQYAATPKDNFFLPQSFTDPWGKITFVTYNDYLLPNIITSITDAIGNVTSVSDFDYRVLMPTTVVDPNNNSVKMLYDELGLIVAVAFVDKDGHGDYIEDTDVFDETDQADFWTLANPTFPAQVLLQGATWRCIYKFDSIPVAVAMIARTTHFGEDINSPVLIKATYSDGLGRIAMHKEQTDVIGDDEAVQWIGNGKTVYNNKGNPVQQYEPYYSPSILYDALEAASAVGVSALMHYDALNRVVRTDMPDGSYTLNLFPDAWSNSIYDRNDTVLGVTVAGMPPFAESAWYTAAHAAASGTPLRDAADKTAIHANTPTTIHFDNLGRPFYTTQKNRDLSYADGASSWSDITDYNSYVLLDIQGNRLAVHDARGLTPLTYSYNLLKVPVRQVSLDSGTSYTLTDIAGQPLYTWDADMRCFNYTYDVVRRQHSKTVLVAGATAVKMLEYMLYGEGISDDMAHNLRGNLYQCYDGAGLQTITDYDFKGNVIRTIRAYTVDGSQSADWQAFATGTGPGPLVETTTYTTVQAYNALNQVVSLISPDNNSTLYYYNITGLLMQVLLNDPSLGGVRSIVSSIQYNAKSQRTQVKYANNTTTTYAYDPDTFRVTNIHTTRASDSAVLQDLVYWYDPEGNITQQQDNATQGDFFNIPSGGGVADAGNNHTYDPLYRLVRTHGREYTATSSADPSTWNDASKMGIVMPVNNTTMRRYIERYYYDHVGNMTQQKHLVTGGGANWTRDFTIADGSNQMTGCDYGGSGGSETYAYDARGNIKRGFGHLKTGVDNMLYNEENRLETVLVSSSIGEYYQYDYTGQRVRKTTINGAITKTRKYVGQWEVYSEATSGTVTLQRETLHIMDDKSRATVIDTPVIKPSGSSEVQTFRYQYSNHLESAALELDASANIISYEEYYPYGSTSFQMGASGAEVSLKRYRYTGKERDESTGFYYHGARYYVPWMCRWVAVDPLESKYAPESSYCYGHNNPVKWNDPDGMGPGDGTEEGQRMVTRTTRSQRSADGGGIAYDAHVSYWHTGGDNHVKGWYSEKDYLANNRDVLVGLIHAIGPNIQGKEAYRALHLNSGFRWGADEALAKADKAAAAFLKQHQGNISPDFVGFALSEAGGVVSDFNFQHGGTQSGRVEATSDPISDFGPVITSSLLKMGTKAIAEMLASATMEGGLKTLTNSTLRNLATQDIKSLFLDLPQQELKSANYGQIIGWGTGQSAEDVEKTINLTKNLTKSQVASWADQGVPKAWVEDQLSKYSKSLEAGGAKLKNTQIVHRKQLMEKILKLW